MLTHRQHVALRRHAGVPFAGTAQAGRLVGWRFMVHVEDLEFKMNNLQPAEEQLITGNAMASWQISDNPTAGDALSFSVTDANGTTQVDYTVTSQDLNPAANVVNPAYAAPTFSIALNAATIINRALGNNGYAAAAVMPADLFSPQYMPPYFAQVVITGPSSVPFTIAAASTGTTNFIVGEQGGVSPIAAVINGVQVYGYAALLDALAMGPAQADLSLWLEKADVVTFRKDEVSARRKLYYTYIDMYLRDIGCRQYIAAISGRNGGAIA